MKLIFHKKNDDLVQVFAPKHNLPASGCLISSQNKPGVSLGDLIMAEDGYFYFFPEETPGCAWSNWMLQGILDKLNELNKDWDATVAREIGGSNGQ